MKSLLITAIFVLGASAQAACISQEEAQATGRYFLMLEGEKTFPYLFEGKPGPERNEIIERVSAELQPYQQEQETIGYMTLAYEDRLGEQYYQEFLYVSCEGVASKYVQRND